MLGMLSSYSNENNLLRNLLVISQNVVSLHLPPLGALNTKGLTKVESRTTIEATLFYSLTRLITNTFVEQGVLA